MIVIDKKKKEILYMQIYHQIKDEIMRGILKEGDILQGSRSLASNLKISRNTVDTAYSQLEAEGYIVAQKGIGYKVLKLPSLSKHIVKEREKFGEQYRQKKSYKEKDSEKKAKPSVAEEVKFDLANSSYSNDLFPKTLWKKTTLECLEMLDHEERLSSMIEQQGAMYLRENLMNYLTRIRGIHGEESQMIITCGLQYSLELVCKLLRDKKCELFIEEPGYHKAAAVFLNNGIKVNSIPVDEDGIIVSKLPGKLPEKNGQYLVYLTPSHQFPTGVTMPINRRLELLDWAREMGAYILEDDFDSELRYYTKPIPALQSIDHEQHVVYLGTFSKALSPSVRMGYMILPEKLLHIFLERFKDYNTTVSILNQYVVARMIETGAYDRHVRRMNHIFKKRLETFEKEFANMKMKVKITGNGTGQYFLLEFSGKDTQEELIKKALKYGVRVYSTMQFWRDKAACPPNTLFLGFSKIDQKDIADCVRRLKEAWE